MEPGILYSAPLTLYALSALITIATITMVVGSAFIAYVGRSMWGLLAPLHVVGDKEWLV